MAYCNVYITYTSALKRLRDLRTKETVCTKQAVKWRYDTLRWESSTNRDCDTRSEHLQRIPRKGVAQNLPDCVMEFILASTIHESPTILC
jgi:hypothetical protein